MTTPERDELRRAMRAMRQLLIDLDRGSSQWHALEAQLSAVLDDLAAANARADRAEAANALLAGEHEKRIGAETERDNARASAHRKADTIRELLHTREADRAQLAAARRRFRSVYAPNEPTDWHAELLRLDTIGYTATRDAATAAIWSLIGVEAQRDALARRLAEAEARNERVEDALRDADDGVLATKGRDFGRGVAFMATTVRAALAAPTEGATA